MPNSFLCSKSDKNPYFSLSYEKLAVRLRKFKPYGIKKCTKNCASMHSFLCTILVVHGFDDHSVWFNMKKRSSLGWKMFQKHLAGAKSSSSCIMIGLILGHSPIRVRFIGSIASPFYKSIILWIRRIEIE